MIDAPAAERCLWHSTAVPKAPCAALAGAAECDVAIVGGGIAGLSCALHLAERGAAVALLEAQSFGAGASGRCGGQVLAGGRHGVEAMVEHHGERAGRALHAFGNAAAEAAFAIVRRLKLDCDALQAGSIYAADSAAGMAEVDAKWAALQARGIGARRLDRDELFALTGSPAYLGGYLNPQGGSVQPLSLVRELPRAAQGFGARLFESSPADALERRGAGWRLRTSRGTLDTRRVLVATNGRAGALAPVLERGVLSVRSFQVATDPLPRSAGVLPGAQVVSDTRRVLRYFRVDRHGRVVMGSKGTLAAPRGPASFALQRRALERVFPQLAGVNIAWWWGGEVSITPGRQPCLYTLGEGVLASVACNGKGVAWNLALGPVLADALTGVPLEALPLPPARPVRTIPLHNLRSLYTAAGGAWLRLLDGLDTAPRPSH